MKKVFTFVIALMGMFAVMQNASALVYNVTVPVGTQLCFIAGDMNGWGPSVNPMTQVDATHFTINLPNAVATNGYKYLAGWDWKYEELNAAGVTLPANRTWTANDVVASFKAVQVKHEGNVLIEVLVPSTTVECYIVGNFNGWPSPTVDNKMIKGVTSGGTTVFSKTIHTLDSLTTEFKFCSGPAWSYEQLAPSGNFVLATSGDAIIVTSFKAIYDPAKTGTINITATVPSGTSEAWIMGDFLGWNMTMTNALKGTKNVDGTWSFSIPMVMSIQYRLYNHNNSAYAEVGQGALTTDLPNRSAVYPTDANTSITVYAWKQAFTALNPVNADNYKIYAVGKTIVVEGVTSQVDIIDLSGRSIQSSKLVGNFTSKALTSGLYIVRVDGATRKVSLN